MPEAPDLTRGCGRRCWPSRRYGNCASMPASSGARDVLDQPFAFKVGQHQLDVAPGECRAAVIPVDAINGGAFPHLQDSANERHGDSGQFELTARAHGKAQPRSRISEHRVDVTVIADTKS